MTEFFMAYFTYIELDSPKSSSPPLQAVGRGGRPAARRGASVGASAAAAEVAAMLVAVVVAAQYAAAAKAMAAGGCNQRVAVAEVVIISWR